MGSRPTISARRALAVGALAALLTGACTAIAQGQERAPRHARVLLLDSRTGAILHARSVAGGFAQAALLKSGRVAVASLDSCPDQTGGQIAVLDKTLKRVTGARAIDPCDVMSLDAPALRARFGEHRPELAPTSSAAGLTVRLGKGKIVESVRSDSDFFYRLVAYDASGKVLWRRVSANHFGAVDVRDGRVVVTVLGTFVWASP